MRDYYNPAESVLGGVRIGQAMDQSQAAQLANQKARQEMQDFYATGEALKGMGNEPMFGLEDIQRPDSLKKLYLTNPQAARALEKDIFGAEYAARKTGQVEAAKRTADWDVQKKAIDRLMPQTAAKQGAAEATPGLNAAGEMQEAPSVYDQQAPQATPAGRGIQPVFEITPTGLKIKLDPYEEEKARVAQEQLGLEKTTRREATDRTKEVTAKEKNAALLELQNQRIKVGEGVQARTFTPAQGQAELARIDRIEQQIEGLPTAPAGPAQAARATAPTAQPGALGAPPAASPGGMNAKEAAEEAKLQRAEARQEGQTIRKEQRTAYEEQVFKPLNIAQNTRQNLAGAQIDNLIKMNNTGKFGQPILTIPGLSAAVGATADEANQFRQGFSAIVQSFITPGTSGTVNTIAEQEALQRGLGGIAATPAGNALTLASMKNGMERAKYQQAFFREMQKRGTNLEDARGEWNQYIDGNAPFKIIGTHTLERNPRFKTPAQWFKGERPKDEGAQAAAQAPSPAPAQVPNGTVRNGMVKVGPNKWAPR